MQKSVYSLVLMDDVVAQIDRAAFAQNTSRSNLINQILADYVSLVTPEKRMQEVFRQVENLLGVGEQFQVLLQPSDSMFSLRSSLAYKYNPNIRYSVELYKDRFPEIGELRVSLRSQNSTLMLYLLQFFKLFTRVEQAFVGETDCAMEPNRYIRLLKLRREQAPTSQALGEAIAAYINLFDACLKDFFANLEQPDLGLQRMERRYAAYMNTHNIIL